MTPAPKPLIAVSACLLGQSVRYDGGHKEHPWIVSELGKRYALLGICPEAELGLGVPRPPIEVQKVRGRLRLWMPSQDKDLSIPMTRWAEARIAALVQEPICGMIFKARSPSCGVGTTPQKDPQGHEALGYGDGYFVMALRRLAPSLPLIEGETLDDPPRRDVFLAAVDRFIAEGASTL